MYWIAYAQIVAGLLIYQTAQKNVPKSTNPFWFVALSYGIGMLLCLALAWLLPRPAGSDGAPPTSVISFDRRLLWYAMALGVGATLIEVGYFFGYRSGWALSELPLFVMVTTSACLAVAGALYFHESLTPIRLIGLALASLGLFLVLKTPNGA